MIEGFDPMQSRMAQIMDVIANRKYQIPTGTENIRRWGIVSHGIGEVDDEIDGAESDDVRWKVVKDAASFLGGESSELINPNERYVDRMRSLHDLLFELPEERKTRFVGHFLDFAKVTIQMRSEASFRRMVELRGKEGDLTATFFHDVVTENVRFHPNFNRYVRTTNALYRAGCFYDSTQDLPFDRKNGIVSVNPGPVNRGSLLLLTLKEGLGVLGELNYSIVKSVINREKFVMDQNKKTDRRG